MHITWDEPLNHTKLSKFNETSKFNIYKRIVALRQLKYTNVFSSSHEILKK